MEDKDELIKAQNEVIGILFEVIKKLQENIDLQEEGVQLIIKSKDTNLEENLPEFAEQVELKLPDLNLPQLKKVDKKLKLDLPMLQKNPNIGKN